MAQTIKAQPALGRYAAELEALQKMAGALGTRPQDTMETTALYFFKRLSRLYQLCLMTEYQDSRSEHWIRPSLDYFAEEAGRHSHEWIQAPTAESIHRLIGWTIEENA